MHVRVICPHGQGEIMFACTMPDPMHNEKKPCPVSWRFQLDTLEALQEEGLALMYPEDLHALDKAAWQSALMSEIIFDTRQQMVACTFFDQLTLSWPMSSLTNPSRCMSSLELVMSTARGMNPSPEPGRRHWIQDLPSSSVAQAAPALPVETAAVSTSSHRTKHRRQKSLLGSIVSAFKGILPENLGRNSGPILPSSLPPLKIPSGHGHSRSPSTFSRTQLSPPGSPTVLEPPPPPPVGFRLIVRPRAPIPPPRNYRPLEPDQILRRYVRSFLIDVVREHVYPMFSTTGPPSFVNNPLPMEWTAHVAGYPPGLYPAWAARSMLRQTEERLREMIAEANARGLGDALASGAVAPAPMSRQSSQDSDSDDTISASTSASATSLTTETDGSSVHTPIDSPTCSPFVPGVTSFAQYPQTGSKALPHVPRSPSPPGYDFDMPAYHALTNLRARLFSILSRLGSTPRQIHNMQQSIRNGSDLTVLEIKSRRRAWSCRDYVGGARLSLVGLSTPARSSPLARCDPVTAETLAQMQAQAAQENMRARPAFLADEGAEFGVPGACAGVKVMTKELDSRLFSLEEEDEDDEDDSQGGYQSGYSFDEYVEDEEWRRSPEYDLESGLLAFPRPEAVVGDAPSPYSFPHSQSHPMVRPRTQSMRVENPSLSSSASEPHSLCSSEGGLSPNSLLCQPLNVKVPVPVLLDNGDLLGGGLGHGAEFTLAMDLPSPFSPAPQGWVGDGGRPRR